MFKVPLKHTVIETSKNIVRNLKRYSKDADELILWLDCDREGEAIAYDVIE